MAKEEKSIEMVELLIRQIYALISETALVYCGGDPKKTLDLRPNSTVAGLLTFSRKRIWHRAF
jgi:hypothetical protein